MMQTLIGRQTNSPNDAKEGQSFSSPVQQSYRGMEYKGWISQEVFSRSLWQSHESVPEEHAMRAQKAWQKLVSDISPAKVEMTEPVEEHKSNGSAFSSVGVRA